MIAKFAIWFIVLAALFTGLIFWIFISGIVYQTRDEEGHIKKGQRLSKYTSMIVFAATLLIVLTLFNYHLFYDTPPSIIKQLVWNFMFMMSLVLYDSIVIDIIVIGYLRPSILKLPDTMNLDSMKVHLVKTFTYGWMFIIPLTVIPIALHRLIIN